MDQVTVTRLFLADVAKFWAREQTAIYTENEIVQILVQAFWKGDLIVDPPAGHVPRGGDYRYSLLKAIACSDNHPGLLLVRPAERVGPAVVDLPDGGALVDLRTRIDWVAVGAEPDEATAEAAFSSLASESMAAYDAATTLPILHTLLIERDELQRYCERENLSLPQFWFSKRTQRRTASAERQCERWLTGLDPMSGKPSSKARIRDDAIERFPGLSPAAFNRAWTKAAPAAWKKSGAPKKLDRRNNR